MTYLVKAGPRSSPKLGVQLFPAFEQMISTPTHFPVSPIPRTAPPPRSRASVVRSPLTIHAHVLAKAAAPKKTAPPASPLPAVPKHVPAMDYKRALEKLRAEGLAKFRAKLVVNPLPKKGACAILSVAF